MDLIKDQESVLSAKIFYNGGTDANPQEPEQEKSTSVMIKIELLNVKYHDRMVGIL
jgi:hypothetical protein